MTDFVLRQDLATRALSSARLDRLGRTGVDLSTIGTWDPHLSRRTRILVPIDVQAYVAVAGATEPTVDVRAASDDPAPFADGAPREAGIHLHWAMPDALLAARHVEGQPQPQMADLPDAWVVVRTLQPVGSRQVIPTGWVIDARTGQVTPLPSYTGPVADPVNPITPLNGAHFGLMAIASYVACRDRFAFHDPLSDLPALANQAPQGFAGDQAVYTIAGWWTDASQDPVNGAKGPAGLDDALAGLGWYIVHDANDDDVVEPDVRTAQREARLGLKRPVDQVPPRAFGSDGRVVGEKLTGVSLAASVPVDVAEQVFVGVDLPTYQTLLHGSILGVPVNGVLPGADDRPPDDAVALAVGADGDDIAAAFGAGSLGLGDDARGLAEDALEAFVAGVPTLLGSSDGLDDFAVRQHSQGFWSLPGTPLPGTRPDRVRVQDTYAMGPTTVGRKGRAGLAAATRSGVATAKSTSQSHALGAGASAVSRLSWRTTFDLGIEAVSARPRVDQVVNPPTRAVDQGRTVDRPPPRYHRPAPFVLALRGAHPSHRHHGDGLFDKDGRLLCRYPRSAVPSWDGLVDGSVVLPTLGSGAIPGEVLTVVREAVLLNPYAGDWLARAGAPSDGAVGAYSTRLGGEMVRLFGAEGRYDGITGLELAQTKGVSPKLAQTPWAGVLARRLPEVGQITDVLAQHSVLHGLPPSPVALTTWRQPWVPLWLEWEVTLTGASTVRGWHLDGYDLEPDDDPSSDPVTPDTTVTLQGRSPLGEGVGKQIQAALGSWVTAEGQRAVTTSTDPYDASVVPELAALGQPLDLLSASLDGLREQLLGLAFIGNVERAPDGTVIADADPTVLFGGTLRIDRVRLVDAFGRVLSLGDPILDATVTTSELEVSGVPRTIRVRPRLQDKARWLLRLVDAGQPPGTGPGDLHEAYVDQLDPGGATNPVSGFLLPDHIDESLESFTVTGSPLGEIGHDDVTGAVTWEPAPGRPVTADSGPLVGTQPPDRYVAEIAAGIARADAQARALPPESRPADSALTALLRVVDTTLWTVDTYATVGTGTVAGLVGRPIAVVRASLSLDVPEDLDEVTVTAAGGTETRSARFAAVGDELVEVKLGTLTRSDDALLGYFVDDDYEHLHVVDKALATNAGLSGRLVGQLGQLGALAPTDPIPTSALVHPYLVTEGVIRVRPRQTTMLTLLMLPLGTVNLTSGLLPRKEIALSESWFAAGMKALVPSVRVGPLLVDPDEIRLPLVDLLGDKQTFTRRTGPLTWKDDPIVAASETAYLPRTPHEVQEGWIRVSPPTEASP